MPESPVRDRHILIIEDEYYFADALETALRKAGARIVGPAPSVQGAFDLLGRDPPPEAAILDLNLCGEFAFRIADTLLERDIPFVFATGYDHEFLPERHGSVRWLKKPVEASTVLAEVEGLFAGGGGTDGLGSLPRRKHVTMARNGLLARLPSPDLALVMPHLERVTLRRHDVIQEPRQPITHAYFFEAGIASEIAVTAGGKQMEIGLAGREGFSGVPLALGIAEAQNRTLVQAGGVALRITAGDLRHAMRQSEALHALLLRYAHVFMGQIAASTSASGLFIMEQRLARWLLMAHDRLDGDEIPLTHEVLAQMLGVNRPGVTNAVHGLEGHHAIASRRGCLIVLDRRKLETIAGDSYGVAESEYERWITRADPPSVA